MTQCTTCDRPEATDEEWRDVPGGKRSDLCWGGLGCRANAVNWRDRALTLSAALDEARRERDEAREALRVSRLANTMGRSEEEQRLLGLNAAHADERHRLLGEVAKAKRDCEAMLATVDDGDRVNGRLMRERDEARLTVCSLLSGHLSPSDAVRQSAISAAVETRRGWGM